MERAAVSETEVELLRAAQAGDEAAFVALVRPCRAELHAHCYRMLASQDDADDAVQEALIRAWKALERFEARSSVRTWLFRITTNTALDLASARARRELPVSLDPSDGSSGRPTTDVSWIGPLPSQSDGDPETRYAAVESIELAYVAALQFLPARQRAIFILREVLQFRASEVAEMLAMSVAAANSALQRARASLADRLPKVSQATELARLGDAAVREVAARYARAIEEADIEALLELLTEDATWSMPPETVWFRGQRDVARFLRDDVFPQRWHHVVTTANGQLAVAGYIFEPETELFVACALDVLDLRDGRIAAVTGFLTTEVADPTAAQAGLFARFDLPDHLPVWQRRSPDAATGDWPIGDWPIGAHGERGRRPRDLGAARGRCRPGR